ncbi:MAG: 3-hydroxyacyl-CoA dehydrogenase NAD-binding domain-containing protein [Wenzhouxiangellaceae bacterium]|nr:3-hydroxyacyl-CoA dehydrogenase NAD-binding domain-containing protein [Wenzhouxiangellaceae bacterium]
MSTNRFIVKKAAVLGAGVMGAQIAAHLAAAGIPVRLFDLPAKDGDRNGLVKDAIARLAKLKPAPLADKDLSGFLYPANFEDDADKVADCDFVIEAVAERMDIKKSLYDRIAPHLKDDAVLASNTSGLSITELAEVLPERVRNRFCGVHFFNPPRYMHLVELIPHADTDPQVLDRLEVFLTQRLGKGVVRTRDTVNFIANRVGVFSMLSTVHHARRLGLGFDTVDALTGPAIGRPKSATFRLADVVGLDTMANVISTMQRKLEDDPWHPHYEVPDWMRKLIDAGALGQKSGAGVFRKEGKQIRVLSPGTGEYRDTDYSLDDDVKKVLAIRDPVEKMAVLAESGRPELEFLWAIHRDLFHYCAVHLDEIADSAREIDLAMRWGYGWKQGPFEIWQAAGWSAVAERIGNDIKAGNALADTALPDWVAGVDAAHSDQGSITGTGDTSARPELAVFERQLLPPRLIGETAESGTTVAELPGARLWTLDDDVLIVSHNSKMNVIDGGVIDGLSDAIDRAEREFAGIVIWQPNGPFSAGANLKAAMEWVDNGEFDKVEKLVEDFQNVNLRLRYAAVPSVAAVRGLALGGGLELAMHASRIVAHLESYMGLVEAGVGLLPAGGGLGTLAFRIHDQTQAGDSYPLLEKRFKQVAMGQVSGSAMEARSMGYLGEADRIVMHEHELLYAAHGEIGALNAAGYRPPLPGRSIPAAGDVGIATLEMLLVNMLEGHFISPHDYEISKRIAETLSGGAIDRDTPVDERWIYALERRHFVELAKMKPTQERIVHMLNTGKPLRN